MSSTVPLTQDVDSVAKTHELVPSENMGFENHRGRLNGFQDGRWIRWLVALLMLMGLVWFMIFSKESSEPVGLEPVATPRSINGTDLMVRAYKIPDPSEARLGQRSFSGTLQARYQSLLGFRVAGKIIHRGVEVGDRVTKGQILFRLDPTDYDLQLQVAQADLEAAKSQLVQIEAEEGRLADLRKTRSTSQSDYDLAVSLRDTARSRMQAAGNRETLAKNQRQYADLVADQDGLVTRLMAEVGQVVSPGQPVGQWVHGTELEAVVSVPESMQQALSQSRASVEFWSMPGVSVPCTLREISPIADPASRTYDAKFTLVDPPTGLAIGMTANVVIYRDQEDGFSIPMGAIAESQGSPIVWRIVADGRVQAVPVEILKYGSQFATVRGSLGQGDQIISAGVQRIDPQCKVRVWQDNL
ncbi:MAG: efflux RND transporter periplasmic adaptor subunit [Pirellula sp.]